MSWRSDPEGVHVQGVLALGELPHGMGRGDAARARRRSAHVPFRENRLPFCGNSGDGHSPATGHLLSCEMWRGGRSHDVRRSRPLYSFVRFAAATSLIAFGGIITIGALALIPSAAQRVLVAGAEMSRPPAIPCERQTSLGFDPDCSAVTPQRDLPRIAGYGGSSAVTGEVPAPAEKAPEKPVTETERPAAAVPQGPARQAVITAPERPAAVAPEPARQAVITAPERVTPVSPPATEQRPSPKPMIKAQARPPAAKKVVRRDQAAKRSTSEALRTVRRFGRQRHPAGHSGELLRRRRAAAHDRHPADIRAGRLLLLGPPLIRRRLARKADGRARSSASTEKWCSLRRELPAGRAVARIQTQRSCRRRASIFAIDIRWMRCRQRRARPLRDRCTRRPYRRFREGTP